jgi:flagellar biosynthesis/type III secretory pathway M-ring protein FliF/YscJ
VIDGIYNKDASGTVTYQPRSKEEIDQIMALVKSGIGFDAKRGDQVEVSNIRFAELPNASFETEAEPWYKLPNLDLNKTLELLALLIMASLVALFVGRPLARALGKPDAISIAQNQNSNEIQQIGSNPVERVTALISTKPQASVATIRQWLREPAGGA